MWSNVDLKRFIAIQTYALLWTFMPLLNQMGIEIKLGGVFFTENVIYEILSYFWRVNITIWLSAAGNTLTINNHYKEPHFMDMIKHETISAL